MTFNPTIEKLIQAHAHADAGPFPTIIKLWRNGVDVDMRAGNRRVDRRITWTEIDQSHINPIMIAIDDCTAVLSGSKR